MGTRNERAVDGETLGSNQPPPPPGTSSRKESTSGGGGGGGVFIGKHRLAAAIACLDQEILSLQANRTNSSLKLKELTELEVMEPSSAACSEVIASTEGKPDPLLPITTGPENSSWERWFQRVRSSRTNKWWAPKTSEFA